MEPLEAKISKIIWKETLNDWLKLSNVDVVVVGAGPSGMVTAKYLADSGIKTLVLERRLSFGGGIGGGGMLMHKVVVDSKALNILDDFKIKYSRSDYEGLYVVDASELMAKLAAGAIDSGAKIVNGITVEDLIVRDNPFRVEGVVIQWSAVNLSGLHVDPLFIYSKAVVDATGHDAEVLKVLSRKNPEVNLKIPGEKSAYAELSEELVVKHSGKVLPGLYVSGMAVAALYGIYRMGPIFTGMLLSGKKVAEEIAKDLRGGSQ
ncbi:MAG: ribose 1,5-bisphosphate isomerase [Zestosphaera tikiterensis]|uniref:Thiamine thiazole synthase n=1 Tax=Zestosphaera tikiterensis TaxID=1973259 RepID=A0A2R7Y7P0_9CREN|nr:MAG: ribose 1,5-bisphosphate isomerase [Zestosphaera tikiterensis]